MSLWMLRALFAVVYNIHLLYIFMNTWYYRFLDFCHYGGQYAIIVWICISLIINDIENHFQCLGFDLPSEMFVPSFPALFCCFYLFFIDSEAVTCVANVFPQFVAGVCILAVVIWYTDIQRMKLGGSWTNHFTCLGSHRCLCLAKWAHWCFLTLLAQ